MRMVIDHDDSPAVGNKLSHSPLGRASIDGAAGMTDFERPLDLNTPKFPFLGSGRSVDRPDKTLKTDALARTRLPLEEHPALSRYRCEFTPR